MIRLRKRIADVAAELVKLVGDISEADHKSYGALRELTLLKKPCQ